MDSGGAVNPDGIRNQIEGAIVESLSWTGLEAVGFDATHRASCLTARASRSLGSGEAGQGPAAAALANAVADAASVRLRDMPLSADRLKAAIGV